MARASFLRRRSLRKDAPKALKTQVYIIRKFEQKERDKACKMQQFKREHSEVLRMSTKLINNHYNANQTMNKTK